MFATSLEPAPLEGLSAELRAADAAIARVVSCISTDGIEDVFGLPAEMRLMLQARWTRTDVRMLFTAAGLLRHMPLVRRSFVAGELSRGQVRAVVCMLRAVPVGALGALDMLIARRAAALVDHAPEELLDLVDGEVARLRDDLVDAREERAIERRFLQVQGRLDGSGSLYGEADAESLATIVAALDAAAERPANTEDDGAPSRAQQRMDALIALSEASLGNGAGRPRPRVYATVDASEPEHARLLWGLPGAPPRMSGTATETLLCDAEIVPVVFDRAPLAEAGGPTKTLPDKVRTAVLVRDGGCRFPGCGTPMGWCDVHHATPRVDGGSHDPANLVSLCRRCHRRMHRYRWKIRHREDGTITFTHRGRTFASAPRARPLLR